MKQLLAALDVDTTAEALALAGQLRGSVAGFTVGNRLFTSAGPAVVGAIVARGDRVSGSQVSSRSRRPSRERSQPPRGWESG